MAMGETNSANGVTTAQVLNDLVAVSFVGCRWDAIAGAGDRWLHVNKHNKLIHRTTRACLAREEARPRAKGKAVTNSSTCPSLALQAT